MGQAEAKPGPRQGAKGRLQKQIKEQIQGKEVMGKVLQLVLVGPRGSGKSSAGNSILGWEAFKTDTGTLTCQTENCETGGRAVSVTDTPGLTGHKDSDQEVIGAISQACQDLLELPVVFLLVVPLGWNAETSQDGPCALRHALGKVSLDHMMVLVTHVDQFQQDTPEDESFLWNRGLLKLTVGQCGRWFHLFNTAQSGGSQVSELLDKLDQMMQEGKKTQEPEEQVEAPAKAVDQPKVHPNHEGPIQKEAAEPRTPEGTGRIEGMWSVRKVLQKLQDQMKSRQEEEEELARERNLEYGAQLQKIRERMLTLKA